MLEDDLQRYGIATRPCHLLCTHKTSRSGHDVVRHTHRLPLPGRSLIVLDRGTLVVSPELLFLELAASAELDDTEIIQIGFELCGTYLLDASELSWNGFTNTAEPLTCTKKIMNFLDRCRGRRGVNRARALARCIADGANSPMETITAMLVSLPKRLGGWNLGAIAMNHPINTTQGVRWVDIMFIGRRVGLEYKGRRAHAIERTARDDRRQNHVQSTGTTIINIWYEDLADDHLFAMLMCDIAHALGIRPRQRSESFIARQRLLRAQLLPALQRFGSFDA